MSSSNANELTLSTRSVASCVPVIDITEAVANVTEKYKKLMLAPLGSAGSIWEKGRRYVIMLVSPAEVYPPRNIRFNVAFRF